MKTCTKCNVTKDLESFYRNANNRDGKQSNCKACSIAASVKSASANPARIAAARAATQAYKAANSERVRTERKDYDAQYHQDNKAARRAHVAKRRAIKIRACPTWSDPVSVAAVYTACDFLNMVTGEWHHVDHIVPLQHPLVCGLHVPANLQVLTASENISKSNRFVIGA